MTFEDENGPMDEGDDMIAAEYVVGVFSAVERQEVAARIEHDAAFARLVDAWESWLSPLADSYAEVEAPAAAKQTIDLVLFAGTTATAPAISAARHGVWQSLAFWRGFAAALAVLIVAVAVPLLRQGSQEGGTRFVASIASRDTNVSYLAYYDPSALSLSLSPVSGARGGAHDFELWAIEGQEKPVSLGVIPTGKAVRVKISPEIGGKLAKGGVLAISLETAGGSPTGQPTGPVVAIGSLNQI